MPFKPRSDFLHIMNSRGFLQDCSDLEGLDERMKKETISAYIGFDATADSLHVGSLIQIMMLRWLQKTGHRPIALMGGGTTKIGDPSGKDQSRQLLTSDEIQQNIINRIKKNSLSNLEKKLRKNRKITINDFKDVAQKVNN